MLCVLRRPGVDFPEMVGRLAGEEVGAFGALNLYLQKSAQFQSIPARVGAGAGGISSICIEAAIDDDARVRTPPDAGMEAISHFSIGNTQLPFVSSIKNLGVGIPVYLLFKTPGRWKISVSSPI